MISETITSAKAKPFLKWAGGKTRLLPVLDYFLPRSFCREKEVTYIEPFVGGGAMLFFMLQKYPNIRKAVINDINSHLINAYKVIRDEPFALIDALDCIQHDYRRLADYESQKAFYINIRSLFNNAAGISDIEDAAYLIFMNRTCFNGLYRENSKGAFNVPFGRYHNPTICDADVIMADSRLLAGVDILNGDFAATADYVDGYTLVYCDPPYRPLDATSNFNSYVKEAFNDDEQKRLKQFFASLSEKGCHVMLSNSDGKARDESNVFFDRLYSDYSIERIFAKRCINCNPNKRGAISELLIRNYTDCRGAGD